jgi:hypothetical protein
VLFDVNRFTEIEPLMKSDPASWIEKMVVHEPHTYTVEALVNESEETERVAIRRKRPGPSDTELEALADLRWPRTVYSLAHVALPFPPDDPLYGGPDAGESPGIQLGDIALRGEKGVLLVSGSEMLRLRWNPFHAYVVERFMGVIRDARERAASD